ALGIWQPKIVIEARFSRIVTSTGSLLCSSGSREQGLSPAGHGWSLAHGRFLYLSRLPEGRGMSNRTEDFKDNGLATLALKEVSSGEESLAADRCLEIYRIMVRTRAMEERMVKMSKSGQGHFWIGGPGEEAFNTCLGLQVKKGQGPAFDFLHLHYRN